jgi:hypothetical protein
LIINPGDRDYCVEEIALPNGAGVQSKASLDLPNVHLLFKPAEKEPEDFAVFNATLLCIPY